MKSTITPLWNVYILGFLGKTTFTRLSGCKKAKTGCSIGSKAAKYLFSQNWVCDEKWSRLQRWSLKKITFIARFYEVKKKERWVECCCRGLIRDNVEMIKSFYSFPKCRWHRWWRKRRLGEESLERDGADNTSALAITISPSLWITPIVSRFWHLVEMERGESSAY